MHAGVLPVHWFCVPQVVVADMAEDPFRWYPLSQTYVTVLPWLALALSLSLEFGISNNGHLLAVIESRKLIISSTDAFSMGKFSHDLYFLFGEWEKTEWSSGESDPLPFPCHSVTEWEIAGKTLICTNPTRHWPSTFLCSRLRWPRLLIEDSIPHMRPQCEIH